MSARAATVEFMSQQHVERMNQLLAASAEVRAACASLPAPRVLGYRLTNGPGGQTVHWRMSFQDTVQFQLEDLPSDVLYVGDWSLMIRASRSSREKEAVDPQVVVEGDPAVLAEIGPVMAVARTVATLDVHFPEVPS